MGSSIPGVLNNIQMTPPSRKRKLDKRGSSNDVNNALTSMPSSTRLSIFLLSKSVIAAFSDFSIGSFNKNISTTLPPISVNKDFPVFSQNISCSQNVNAGINIDLDAKVDAQVTVGVVAKGKLIPPSVSEFAMFAGKCISVKRVTRSLMSQTLALSADLDGTLNIGADAVVRISSLICLRPATYIQYTRHPLIAGQSLYYHSDFQVLILKSKLDSV